MKILISAIVSVALVAVGGFFLTRYLSSEEAMVRAAGLNPWMEVIAPPVFELDPAGDAQIRQLATGDELRAGAVVETRDTGSANLYFPDGSLMRIDSKTRFTLKSAQFNPDDQTLRVRIALAAGRVWSKIIGLATPTSLWEVRTSNAVATTRGTAFAVEYKDGVSRVIGSEKHVLVTALDPQTQKPIPDAAVEISADRFIAINFETVQLAKTDPAGFTRTAAETPPEIREDIWIQDAQAEDNRINERIRQIHAEHEAFTEEEVLQAAAEEIRRRFAPDIRKRREAMEAAESLLPQMKERAPEDEETPPSPTDDSAQKTDGGALTNTEAANPAGTDNLESQKQPMETQSDAPARLTPAAPQDAPAPQRITMEPAAPQKNIREFQPLRFKVILIFSNGERRDITGEAHWQIVGPIGFFKSPGVFIPRLDESVAELGEGFGAAVAVWKDIKTGKEFTAHSAVLKVIPPIEDTTDQRG